MTRTTTQPRSHALAQALPRSAGFALLRPAARPDLDAQRILTMSGTLAINLLALGLLMMPLAMPPPAIWEEPKSTTTVRQIPIEPEVVEIVPVVQPTPRISPTPEPVRLTRATTPSATINTSAVVVDSGSEVVVATASEDAGPLTDLGNAASTGPVAVQLEYLSAPAPKYPRGAQQRQIEGTVLLQVLVGINGRPLDVTVSQSSGNRELDEAARLQILKRWSFRPAMKNGQAVQALGLVPIAFELAR
ncbi:MAG: TonB family protein [Thermomonas sp.]